MKARFALLGALAAVACPAFAQRTIQDLAPESSVVVIGMDNMGATLDRVRNGPMAPVFAARELADARAGFDQIAEMLSMMEEEMNLPAGSLGAPRGAVGMALFTAMNDALGFDTAGFMVMADFGDAKVLEALFTMMDDQMGMIGADVQERDILGRRAFVVPLRDPEAGANDEDEFGGMNMDDPMSMIEPMMAGVDTLYLTHAGGMLLGCTNVSVLENALHALEGQKIRSLRDNATYQAAVEQAGKADGRVVVLVDGLLKIANMQPMMMFMGPTLAQPMRMLGLANIKAMSMSMDMDDEGSMMTQRVGLLLSGERAGLLALLEAGDASTAVPGFVSADATSYMRLNFNFSGLIDLAKAVMASMPELAMQGEDIMAELEPDLRTLFGNMGREMHMATMGEGEFVVAMRCTDAAKVEGVIAQYAPQGGLEPRNFQGHTIYSGDFAPMAVGIGAGHVFVGPPVAVEDALRATGLNGQHTLAGSSAFKAAVSTLGGGSVIGWGYSDTGSLFTLVSSFVGGMAAGMGEQFGAPAGMAPDLPDMAFLKEHIGPSIWRLEARSDGLLLTNRTLAPAR